MPATGQADNTIGFSFDGPSALPTEAELQAAVSNTENPDFQAAEVAKPEVETSAAETKPEQKAVEVKAPEQTASPELKTYKVVVDGQELEVTEADLKAGHMRQRDYTQKTQHIAEEKRALDAERSQFAAKEAEYVRQLQELDAFLSNKEALAKFAKQAHGYELGQPAVALPEIDPTQPPTVAQVAQIAAYNAEQVRLSVSREFDAKLKQTTEQGEQAALRVRQGIEAERLKNDLTHHVNELLVKYPDLKRFEDIDDELMGDAFRRLPAKPTPADAKAQLTAAAERRMATIQAIAGERKKEAAIAAAELKRTSPEPPGGAPVVTQGGRKLTLNTSDRKDLLKANEEALRAFMTANQ